MRIEEAKLRHILTEEIREIIVLNEIRQVINEMDLNKVCS